MRNTILFLVTLFLSNISFSQNNLCFTAAQTTSVTPNSLPISFARADFNNDGIQDICCESYYGVSLLLSNGTGSLATVTTFSLGQSIQFVATNDFNNDGNADIAAFHPDSNKVFIILGSGTGAIQSIITLTTTTPGYLTSSDFNNDGKADLAISNYSASSVSIYTGSGTGNFSFTINYPVGINPTAIIAGDFNNNSFIDLLVLSSGTTRILKGNGTGLFAVTNYNNLPANTLLTADINNDGNLDLIYTVLNGSNVDVLTGNGNYTFNSAVSYSLNSNYSTGRGLYFEDFNNDTKKDLAYVAIPNTFSSAFPCNIDILLGQGAGVFSGPTSFSISSQKFFTPSGFIPADIDNDGKMDFVGYLDNDPGFKVLYNCNTVGIEEKNKTENSITVFPNPATDILNISSDLESLSKIAVIYNNLGQIVKEKEIIFKNNIATIDINDLSKGIYTISLSNPNFVTEKKYFVVSR